jgi:hypothetical protein
MTYFLLIKSRMPQKVQTVITEKSSAIQYLGIFIINPIIVPITRQNIRIEII